VHIFGHLDNTDSVDLSVPDQINHKYSVSFELTTIKITNYISD